MEAGAIQRGGRLGLVAGPLRVDGSALVIRTAAIVIRERLEAVVGRVTSGLLLQGGRDRAVDATTLGEPDGVVHDFARDSVLETEAVAQLVLLDQVAPSELAQDAGHVGIGDRARNQRGRELAADDGRGLQHAHVLCRETRDPRMDEPLDRRRKIALFQSPLSRHGVVGKRATQLFDEQRIAPGALVDGARHTEVEEAGTQGADEGGGLRLAEGLQPERLHILEHRIRIPPRPDHDEESLGRVLAADLVERFARSAVRPLPVVEHEQDPLTALQRREDRRDRPRQRVRPRRLLLRGSPKREELQQGRKLFVDLGAEAARLLRDDPRGRFLLFDRLDSEDLTQDLEEGPQDRHPSVAVAASMEDTCVRRRQGSAELLDQPRLSDPRGPDDQGRLGLAGRVLAETVLEQLELSASPDERGQSSDGAGIEAAEHGRAAAHAMGADGSLLALERDRRGLLDHEERLDPAQHRVADPDLIPTRGLAQSRCGIDRVADQLVLPVQRISLAREHASRVDGGVQANFEAGRQGELPPHQTDGGMEIDGSLDGAAGVVFASSRIAEYGQQPISVDLDHPTAVPSHHLLRDGLDLLAKAYRLLGIDALAQGGGVAQVGEQESDVVPPAIGSGSGVAELAPVVHSWETHHASPISA